jgi:hypothetical protein
MSRRYGAFSKPVVQTEIATTLFMESDIQRQPGLEQFQASEFSEKER